MTETPMNERTQDDCASLRDRAVVNGASEAVSAVPASVPSAGVFSGWADQELALIHHEIERAQDRLSGTAKGCIGKALTAIELADEYVAKTLREDE